MSTVWELNEIIPVALSVLVGSNVNACKWELFHPIVFWIAWCNHWKVEEAGDGKCPSDRRIARTQKCDTETVSTSSLRQELRVKYQCSSASILKLNNMKNQLEGCKVPTDSNIYSLEKIQKNVGKEMCFYFTAIRNRYATWNWEQHPVTSGKTENLKLSASRHPVSGSSAQWTEADFHEGV